MDKILKDILAELKKINRKLDTITGLLEEEKPEESEEDYEEEYDQLITL